MIDSFGGVTENFLHCQNFIIESVQRTVRNPILATSENLFCSFKNRLKNLPFEFATTHQSCVSLVPKIYPKFQKFEYFDFFNLLWLKRQLRPTFAKSFKNIKIYNMQEQGFTLPQICNTENPSKEGRNIT